MFCALQVLNCEILSGKIVRKINVVPFDFFCNYNQPPTPPLPPSLPHPFFVNINCHIYPFVIKLWYLLATDETVFIKNVSLLINMYNYELNMGSCFVMCFCSKF